MSCPVVQIVVIGLHGGFGELPTEWKRHLAMGKLAERFRNAERVVDDEDDKDETKPECGLAATAATETAHVEPPPADPAASPVSPLQTETVKTAPTKSNVKEQ